MSILNKYGNITGAAPGPQFGVYGAIVSEEQTKFGVWQNDPSGPGLYMGSQYAAVTGEGSDLYKDTGGPIPFSIQQSFGAPRARCFVWDTETAGTTENMVFGLGTNAPSTEHGQVRRWTGTGSTLVFENAGLWAIPGGAVGDVGNRIVYYGANDATWYGLFNVTLAGNNQILDNVSAGRFIACESFGGNIWALRQENITTLRAYVYNDNVFPATLIRQFNVTTTTIINRAFERNVYISPDDGRMYMFNFLDNVLRSMPSTASATGHVTTHPAIVVPLRIMGMAVYRGRYFFISRQANTPLYEAPLTLASITPVAGTNFPRGAYDLTVHDDRLYINDWLPDTGDVLTTYTYFEP